MSNIPQNLYYTDSHEWLLIEDNIVTIGITDHAQSELGDLVFIQLPEVGDVLTIGGEMAVVESVKAASDVYAPLAGTVNAVNEKLSNSPEMVNQSAYDAWLVKLKIDQPLDTTTLLSPAQYEEKL